MLLFGRVSQMGLKRLRNIMSVQPGADQTGALAAHCCHFSQIQPPAPAAQDLSFGRAAARLRDQYHARA